MGPKCHEAPMIIERDMENVKKSFMAEKASIFARIFMERDTSRPAKRFGRISQFEVHDPVSNREL